MAEDNKAIAVPKNDENLKEGKKKSLKDIQIPKSAAAAIIVVVILVVAMALFLTRGGPGGESASAQGTVPPSAEEASAGAVEVEVLPKTARNFDGDDVKNPFTSDKIGNIKITGIVSNSNGKSTAIIETDVTSYIVSEGDFMPDSAWQVDDISNNSVTFTNAGSKKVFYLSNNTNAGGQK